MSLISDVKYEYLHLELSRKRFRQFGIGGGILFLCFAVWANFSGSGIMYVIIGGLVGVSGITFGFFNPEALKRAYRIWMLLALILGWCVSRLILAVIFFLIITPIGIVAKLIGKKHIVGHRSRESYWLKRAPDQRIDYTKMY